MGQAGAEAAASSLVPSSAVPWAVEMAQLEAEGNGEPGWCKGGVQTLGAALPKGLLRAEQGGSPASLAESQNVPQLITWLSN